LWQHVSIAVGNLTVPVVQIVLRGITNIVMMKNTVFIAVGKITALAVPIVLRGIMCTDQGQRNVSIAVGNLTVLVVPIVLRGTTRCKSNIAGLVVYDGKACY